MKIERTSSIISVTRNFTYILGFLKSNFGLIFTDNLASPFCACLSLGLLSSEFCSLHEPDLAPVRSEIFEKIKFQNGSIPGGIGHRSR